MIEAFAHGVAMNVGIDLRPLVAGESGGIVQLLEGLAPALFAVGRDHRFTIFHSDRYRLPFTPPDNVLQTEAAPGPAALDAELARAGVDVLLRAYPTDELLAFPAAREVTFVPDVLHEDHPEFLDPTVCARRKVAFARAVGGGAVVAQSCHALARIRATYPGASAAPVLIPPAPPNLRDRLGEPLSPADAARIPPGPFFIYPARGWPHKNHDGLLRAWRIFHQSHPEYSLVLTGTGGVVPELLARHGDDSVRDLGFVSGRLMAELFARAAAMVFPSLHEGFGLPLLEAFAFGLPTVCSAEGSLTEVGGDAVLAVDARDPDSLAGAMGRVATDAALREGLVSRGRARLAGYDATASAGALLAVLESVASRPSPGLGEWRAAQAERAEVARLLAYERLLAGTSGPLVSVVVAMGDTRGNVPRCVRAWSREQTIPRDRLEVIIASDGKDLHELERARRELGGADRVVHLRTDSDSALWAEGARHARGRWLYFAEAHSYGEPECLEEMVRYLLAEGAAAASSLSWGLEKTITGLLEDRLFSRVSAQRLQPGHWNKLFMRGCAIERAEYFRAGGLSGEYGLFAEPLLAARLHRAGVRVGHARRSIVRHINAATFRSLEGHIRDYTLHECAFRFAHPEPAWDEYFGRLPDWHDGGRLDAALARVEARVRLKTRRRGGWSLRQLARLLPACILGSRWWRWRAAARLANLRRRAERERDADAQLDAFAEWWATAAARARVDFLTGLGAPPALAGRADVDELPAPHLVGFYPPEPYAGSLFRWSEPLAHVKLVLPPGEQAVELLTRGLRVPKSLEVFVNGRSAQVDYPVGEDGVIRVAVREADRRAGLQYLTIVCEPWDVPGDTRKLGVPLFGIRRAAAQSRRLAA